MTSGAPPRPFLHHLLRRVLGLAVDLYYRRERIGTRDVPASGPVLLVGNHPNGLVDPLVLGTTTPRTLRFLGKAPLFSMPVIGTLMRGFRALPVYRRQDGADTAQNEATFAAVFEALAEGSVVCLFPEGKSHDEPRLAELRTGVARMALGAEARHGWGLGVRVVPVGLVYRAKRRFRSPVGTAVGEPIEARELREIHGTDEREAVRVLTDRVADGLGDVTLQLGRWEDLPLLELAARIAQPGRDLTAVHELADEVARLRARGDEDLDARIDDLRDRVEALHARLSSLGLSVDAIHERYSPRGVARFVARNLVHLLLTLPLAFAGVLLWILPYRLVALVARLVRPTRDVFATVQILAGLLFFPLHLAVLTWLAWSRLGTGVGVALLLLAPPLGLVALAWRDWRRRVLSDVRAFLLLARRRRLRELLVRERTEIGAGIEALRSRLAAS